MTYLKVKELNQTIPAACCFYQHQFSQSNRSLWETLKFILTKSLKFKVTNGTNDFCDFR